MTRESVRKFYDEKGWRPAGDTYVDTQLWSDHRPLMQEYMRRAKARVGRVLAASGRLFLDLGCGAKPEIELGQGFEHHVCVDFSMAGLNEARRKLGERGLYVMADVTELPFPEGTFDAVVSSHVIYHIPGLENQKRAFEEVYRMVKPGHRGAVLYANPYHVRYFDLTGGWKGALHNLRRLGRDLWNRLRGRPHWAADGVGDVPLAEGLFYKAYPPGWIRRFLPAGTMDIRCLGWLTRPFTQRWCRDTPGWRRFLRAVAWLEDHLPHLLAYGGNFVLIAVRKDGRTDPDARR